MCTVTNHEITLLHKEVSYPQDGIELIRMTYQRQEGATFAAYALIADPAMPNKAKAGRIDEITPCLRCMRCTDGDNKTRFFRCRD